MTEPWILRKNRDARFKALGNQHAVEGVTVMEGKRLQPGGIASREIEGLKSGPGDLLVGIKINIELADRCLDHDLGDADRTHIDDIRHRLDSQSMFFGNPAWIRECPQENVCVQNEFH